MIAYVKTFTTVYITWPLKCMLCPGERIEAFGRLYWLCAWDRKKRMAILILFFRIYILDIISFPKRYNTYRFWLDLSPPEGFKVENFKQVDQPEGVKLDGVWKSQLIAKYISVGTHFKGFWMQILNLNSKNNIWMVKNFFRALIWA
jgi:hypothetical protein